MTRRKEGDGKGIKKKRGNSIAATAAVCFITVETKRSKVKERERREEERESTLTQSLPRLIDQTRTATKNLHHYLLDSYCSW